MSASTGASGWHRISGDTARRYRNDRTGEVISRRQYDERFGRAAGTTYERLAKQHAAQQRRVQKLGPTGLPAGRPQVKYTGPMNRYNELVSAYIDHKRAQGITLTRRQARQSDELKRIVRDLKTRSDAPGSRKTKALELLGRRDPSWRFRVGDTETFKFDPFQRLGQ